MALRKFAEGQTLYGADEINYGSLQFLYMTTSRYSPIAPGRKLGVGVCLLAVMLLWVPLWAAALHADGMGCCTDGFCPVHGHQKSDQAAAGQSRPAEAPMECEHHGGTSQNHTGTMKCSMSCCHESGNSLMAAVTFILPPPTAIALPASATAAPIEPSPSESLQSIKPLSPPPRAFPLSV
jgi:hypothetical protein